MDKVTEAMIKRMADEFGESRFVEWSVEEEITRLIWNEWMRRYKYKSESLWNELKREVDNG